MATWTKSATEESEREREREREREGERERESELDNWLAKIAQVKVYSNITVFRAIHPIQCSIYVYNMILEVSVELSRLYTAVCIMSLCLVLQW